MGSDDACVDIYSTSSLARVGYCRGIPSYVTHMDWSQEGKYLQVSIPMSLLVEVPARYAWGL